MGHLTFPIACELVESDVITITDEEMVEGMKMAAERMKLVLEASAGAAVAASGVVSKELDRKFFGLEKVACILCGGNVDVNQLPYSK